MTTKAEKLADLEETRKRLLAWCPKGATVYTGLNHVSRSGMQRSISLYVVLDDMDDGRPGIMNISGYAAQLMNDRRDQKRGGIIVNGAGMDMGFHLVYNLSITLHCPDKYDHDAAYSLKQRWL
jgi:hypothetical protein